MRTSEEIYHQIRWDPRFQAGDFQMGVRRRHGPIEEVPLLTFQPGGDVPWHRIVYIRGRRGIVWDRRDGRDEVAPEDHPEEALFPLSLVCWNVCAGRHGLPLKERLSGLLAYLQPWPADIVVLLEAGDEFCRQLEPGPYFYRSGGLLLRLRQPPQDLREIPLSAGQTALVADLGGLRLAAAHFTSDYRGGAEGLRQQQWQALRPHLEPGPWLVVGDLNARDSEVARWGADLTPPDFSYDPARNRWARKNSRSGRPARHQRLVGAGLCAHGRVEFVELSDHDPVCLEVQPASPRSHRSAWAVLPPPELWPRIDDWRRQHDPAYPRWMPHINLLYPAPLEPDYDQVRLQLAGVEQFELELDGCQRFEQGLYYWKPGCGEGLGRLRACVGGEGPYQPHLSLGRKKPEGEWRSHFPVRFVAHLRRTDEGPFEVVQAIPLRPPHPLYDGLRALCPVPPLVVGSANWGVGEDLDLVLPARLAEVPEARQWERVWRGPGFDLAQAEVDRFDYHWQSVLDRDALCSWLARQGRAESFAGELGQLYAWLGERGLKGQAWGWPGGLAWAVMLAHWGWGSFFSRASHHPWSQLGVGLDWEKPSPRPMTVWSPSHPPKNLTSHVPAELLAQLYREFLEPVALSGPVLRIYGPVEGQGLGLVMDLIRRLHLKVRPFVRSDGCDLYLEGDVSGVLEYARRRLPEGARLRLV